uniref:Fatty-acid amide hydrolase 2 n=1 Tax=Bactrocera dorsalis TaxID=27457 RepID=A0A034VWY8_BACDO
MEFFLRLLQLIFKILYMIAYPLWCFFLPRKGPSTIPPIRDRLLTLSVGEVLELYKQRKLKSTKLVKAYFDRVIDVNSHIHAVVEDRFNKALEEAARADELIARTPDAELPELFNRLKLLGVPFTVKESCGLKDMPFRVGSRQRANIVCRANGETVNNLVAAGGIPILVSITPEYCFSMETNPATQKRCVNPHDSRRTAGGSSGGEGALNGAGASLFGIGSDIGGSIRYPSLFCGVFGHKPTGGITSIEGHFPNCKDKDCLEYLQMGPITRFGRDLSLLMEVMAGKNAKLLDLSTPVETKDIRVFYAFGFSGLNGLLHRSPTKDIKVSIMLAVKFLKTRVLHTQKISMSAFKNSLEMSIGGLVMLKDFPYLINSSSPHKIREHLAEMSKAVLTQSEYSNEALYFDALRRVNGCMRTEAMLRYKAEVEVLKSTFARMLGDYGVLLFPTFPVPALHTDSSLLALWNVDYAMIFNIIGFPATHIPMGRDGDGLPVGFQVVAAPYRDKLCFQIARELEAAFGGWVIPTPHEIQPL